MSDQDSTEGRRGGLRNSCMDHQCFVWLGSDWNFKACVLEAWQMRKPWNGTENLDISQRRPVASKNKQCQDMAHAQERIGGVMSAAVANAADPRIRRARLRIFF